MACKLKQEEIPVFEEWYSDNEATYDFSDVLMEMTIFFNQTEAHRARMGLDIFAIEQDADGNGTVAEEYRITTRSMITGKSVVLDLLEKFNVYPSDTITVTLREGGVFCNCIELDVENINV